MYIEGAFGTAFHFTSHCAATCRRHIARLRATDRMMPDAPARASFEQLAVPLLSALLNHAFWLTRNEAEAEDLTQEALAKALRAFDTFAAGTIGTVKIAGALTLKRGCFASCATRFSARVPPSQRQERAFLATMKSWKTRSVPA